MELGKNFVELLKYTADGAASDFKFFGENIPRKRYNSAGSLLNGTLIYQSKRGYMKQGSIWVNYNGLAYSYCQQALEVVVSK